MALWHRRGRSDTTATRFVSPRHQPMFPLGSSVAHLARNDARPDRDTADRRCLGLFRRRPIDSDVGHRARGLRSSLLQLAGVSAWRFCFCWLFCALGEICTILILPAPPDTDVPPSAPLQSCRLFLLLSFWRWTGGLGSPRSYQALEPGSRLGRRARRGLKRSDNILRRCTAEKRWLKASDGWRAV